MSGHRERILDESRYRLFGSLSCVVIGWDHSKHRISVRGPFKVRRMNRKLRSLGLRDRRDEGRYYESRGGARTGRSVGLPRPGESKKEWLAREWPDA